MTRKEVVEGAVGGRGIRSPTGWRFHTKRVPQNGGTVNHRRAGVEVPPCRNGREYRDCTSLTSRPLRSSPTTSDTETCVHLQRTGVGRHHHPTNTLRGMVPCHHERLLTFRVGSAAGTVRLLAFRFAISRRRRRRCCRGRPPVRPWRLAPAAEWLVRRSFSGLRALALLIRAGSSGGRCRVSLVQLLLVHFRAIWAVPTQVVLRAAALAWGMTKGREGGGGRRARSFRKRGRGVVPLDVCAT